MNKRIENPVACDAKYTDKIKKVLIAGIGNILRMDDGAGVYIVNHIKESGFVLPEYVEIIEIGSAIYDMVPVMMGRKKIVIADALKTDDIPGTVYRIPSEDLRPNYWKLLRNSPELREIIFQLYITSGEVEIDLVGIVPSEIDLCCMSLSDSVKKKIPAASFEVIKAAVIHEKKFCCGNQ